MIKRHTSKDQEGEDSLETAKKAVYVLIVAGVVMWLAPELLFSDTSLTDGKTDNPNSEIAQQVQQFTSDTQIVAKAVLDTLKYVLLAATIGAITFMRIRR